jgi:hypothetical protein
MINKNVFSDIGPMDHHQIFKICGNQVELQSLFNIEI